MTPNVKLFALFSSLWSVLYFAILSWAIADENRRWPAFWIAYLVFGLGFSIAGKQLGKRDSSRNTRRNTRLNYFLAALVPATAIGIIWELLIQHDSWSGIIGITAVGAAILIVALLVIRRYSIKGMHKEDFFK